jgi:hypothetical protein
MARYEVEPGRIRSRWLFRREPGQLVALLVAALFVLAAVLDVGPGVLDNLVHVGFGVAGVALSRDPRRARVFLIAGGVAYFLFWQFGAVIDPALVPLHTTNEGVHLALVASMIGIAVLSGGRTTAPAGTEAEDAAEDAVEDERDVPTGTTRSRPVRNRPPGRGDRPTPPRTAATGRPPAVIACRG